MNKAALQKSALVILGLGLIAFLPMPWLGFFLPKIILLAFGLALLFLSFKEKQINCNRKILILASAYFLTLLVFTIFSQAPLSSLLGVSGAMQGLQTQLLYLGIFFAALIFNQQQENFFLKGLIWIHCFALAYAALQWLNIDPLQVAWNKDAILHRTFSFLGNPNWLAAFIVLTMPLALTHFKKNFWLMFFLQWLILLSTGSKAGLIAAIFISVALLWKDHKKKILLASGGVILLIIFLLLWQPDLDQLLRSTNARHIIWNDSLRLLTNWPWGHGLDIFRFYYPFYTSGSLYQYEDIFAAIDNPHNQIIQLLFEIGPLGLIIFAVLLFTILKAKIKNPISLGVIAYLISNLFGFETIVTGFVFWFLLGTLAKSAHIIRIPQAIYPIFSIVFMIIFYFNAQHLYANFHYPNAQKALSIYPYDRIYLLEARDEKYLSQLQKLANGHDSDVPALQALYSAQQGDSQAAEQYWQEALKQPNNPRNYLIGMEMFQILNQPNKVEELREKLKILLPLQDRIFQKNYPWVVEKISG